MGLMLYARARAHGPVMNDLEFCARARTHGSVCTLVQLLSFLGNHNYINIIDTYLEPKVIQGHSWIKSLFLSNLLSMLWCI